jgi:DNA topoisomerase-6 subunit B
MKLALQECGRKLGQYVRRRQRMKREGEKRDVFERYIGEIAKACHSITGSEIEQVYNALLEQARARTEIADAQLDEEGRFIKDEHGRLAKDDDVVIIGDNGRPVISDSRTGFQPVSDEPRPSGSGLPNPPARSDPAGNKKKKVVKKIAKKRPSKANGAALFDE